MSEIHCIQVTELHIVIVTFYCYFGFYFSGQLLLS